MKKSSKVFVGMDVHKESIDITLAGQGGEVHRPGQIGGDRVSLLKTGFAIHPLHFVGGPCSSPLTQKAISTLGISRAVLASAACRC